MERSDEDSGPYQRAPLTHVAVIPRALRLAVQLIEDERRSRADERFQGLSEHIRSARRRICRNLIESPHRIVGFVSNGRANRGRELIDLTEDSRRLENCRREIAHMSQIQVPESRNCEHPPDKPIPV